MKFAAAMTLYNPEEENIDNLIETAELFDVLYVYDNTESTKPYIDLVKNIDNVIYMMNETNDGLPVAFNQMLELSSKDNVDFLCTLDQDSIITHNNVKQLENYIESNDMENVGIVAPFPTGTKKNTDRSIETVEWVICSGSFVNVSLIRENKIRYDEAYFVDRFDADICMQMRRKGLQIVRMNNVILRHRCGDGNGGHSALRHYYMFRNRYYYNRKYYSKSVAMIRTFFQNIRHSRWIVETPEEFFDRIKVFRVAYEDYKCNKMGKVSSQSLDKMNEDRK